MGKARKFVRSEAGYNRGDSVSAMQDEVARTPGPERLGGSAGAHARVECQAVAGRGEWWWLRPRWRRRLGFEGCRPRQTAENWRGERGGGAGVAAAAAASHAQT